MLAAAPDSARRSGGAPVELWLTAGWFVALLPSKRCERFEEAAGAPWTTQLLAARCSFLHQGSQFEQLKMPQQQRHTSLTGKTSFALHAPRETLEGRTSTAVEKVRVHAAAHKIWLASRSRAASAQP